MKLSEIADRDKKAEFVTRLKDPAAQELVDLERTIKNKLPNHDVKVYGGEGEFATIETCAPWEDNTEGNLVAFIKGLANTSDHWTYSKWAGDASDTLQVRVQRT